MFATLRPAGIPPEHMPSCHRMSSKTGDYKGLKKKLAIISPFQLGKIVVFLLLGNRTEHADGDGFPKSRTPHVCKSVFFFRGGAAASMSGVTPAPPSPPDGLKDSCTARTGSPTIGPCSGGLRGHWGYPGRVPGA